MKNLARGSVFLTLLAMVVSVLYFQQHVEAAFVQANDSQELVENTVAAVEETETETVLTDDKKLVKKTAITGKRGGARSFKAIAYCLRGKTASGGGVRRGIVAADPRVLPLGTRIYVNAGAYSGTYTVTDTGGVIKGNILDVWVPSCSEAIKFGRRSITVSVLGK